MSSQHRRWRDCPPWLGRVGTEEALSRGGNPVTQTHTTERKSTVDFFQTVPTLDAKDGRKSTVDFFQPMPTLDAKQRESRRRRER